MRIVTWNVNSLRTTALELSRVYGSLLGFFDFIGADIVCFQETKIPEDRLDKPLACPDGLESFWSFCRTRGGYSGVATFAREGITRAATATLLDSKEFDEEGRVMVTDHGDFYVVNVYVPNGGDRSAGRPRIGYKMAFLERLLERVKLLEDGLVSLVSNEPQSAVLNPAEAKISEKREKKGVVLCGDINVAFSAKDVYMKTLADPYFSYSKEEIDWMMAVVDELSAVDSLRCFYPTTGYYGLKKDEVLEGGTAEKWGRIAPFIPSFPESFEGEPSAIAKKTAEEIAVSDAEQPELPLPNVLRVKKTDVNPSFVTRDPSRVSVEERARNGARYTCWDTRTEARLRNEGVRIDYAFVSLSLPLVFAGVMDTRRAWSDHVAVFCDLAEKGWGVEGGVRRLELRENEWSRLSSRKWKRFSEAQSIRTFFKNGSSASPLLPQAIGARQNEDKEKAEESSKKRERERERNEKLPNKTSTKMGIQRFFTSKTESSEGEVTKANPPSCQGPRSKSPVLRPSAAASKGIAKFLVTKNS